MTTSKFIPHDEFMQQLQKERLNRLETLEKKVPTEMKEAPRWCVFKTYYDNETKQRQKYILRCDDGKWASSITPHEWSDFKTALEYAQNNNCSGLAFALDGSGLTCIDLDHSKQPNGTYSSLAQEVMLKAGDTYTERSISGEGLHVFVKGDILDGKNGYKNRNDNIRLEVYDSGRFICMTGDILGSSKLLDCTDALKKGLRVKLGKKTELKADFGNLNNESDKDVISAIQRSKKGMDFNAMYSGQNIRGNESETDFAMLNILAFFTKGDTAQMERIFRSSGLYRDGKDKYLKHSIDKAAATTYAFKSTSGKKDNNLKENTSKNIRDNGASR